MPSYVLIHLNEQSFHSSLVDRLTYDDLQHCLTLSCDYPRMEYDVYYNPVTSRMVVAGFLEQEDFQSSCYEIEESQDWTVESLLKFMNCLDYGIHLAEPANLQEVLATPLKSLSGLYVALV